MCLEHSRLAESGREDHSEKIATIENVCTTLANDPAGLQGERDSEPAPSPTEFNAKASCYAIERMAILDVRQFVTFLTEKQCVEAEFGERLALQRGVYGACPTRRQLSRCDVNELGWSDRQRSQLRVACAADG